MAEVVLGARPESLRVILVTGFPFAAVLDLADAVGVPEAWPSPPVLNFTDGTTWTATIDGAQATFAADVATVSAVASTPTQAATLSVGGVLWARGRVEVIR